MREGTYKPDRPAGYKIEKVGGGERLVSAFTIPDEVISRRVFASLMSKNAAKLSARAYAYRRDLSPHDAIDYISTEFMQSKRLFVAEFDFSKFFDTVTHDHINKTLRDLKIRMTDLERKIIDEFLRCPPAYTNAEEKLEAVGARKVGFAQGTSLSLFLANIAVAPLDRALEKMGVSFVRYADDTLIWSKDYSQLCSAVDRLHAESKFIGSDINEAKSEGIRLLVPEGQSNAEMERTSSVVFLGHKISQGSVRMKATAIEKIQTRVNHLLYTNLLMEPIGGSQELGRIGDLDSDYITYLWQLRRYLYGNLSENDLSKYMKHSVATIKFKGAMSYFPLVTHQGDLESLDSWIATRTWLALRKRASMLKPLVTSCPDMWDLGRDSLVAYEYYSTSAGEAIDLRLPSVRRISKVIEKAVQTHGISIMGPKGKVYNYIS